MHAANGLCVLSLYYVIIVYLFLYALSYALSISNLSTLFNILSYYNSKKCDIIVTKSDFSDVILPRKGF